MLKLWISWPRVAIGWWPGNKKKKKTCYVKSPWLYVSCVNSSSRSLAANWSVLWCIHTKHRCSCPVHNLGKVALKQHVWWNIIRRKWWKEHYDRYNVKKGRSTVENKGSGGGLYCMFILQRLKLKAFLWPWEGVLLCSRFNNRFRFVITVFPNKLLKTRKSGKSCTDYTEPRWEAAIKTPATKS